MLAYSDEFQSTLPARGATHLPLLAPPAWNISIHAPRTGSDARQPGHSGGLRYFNPRSPHGERHCAPFMDMGKSVISIHAPRTGSDADLDGHLPSGGDFNPRSPHGERRSQRLWKEYTTCNFNPRSPHGERPKGGEGRGKACKFQSTLPARGATASCPSHPAPPAHFNPRSPHGERRGISYPSFYRKLFQSTLPARGATARRWTACGLYGISIHAPRTGSDLCAVDQPHAGDGISIHAPRTGSDVRRRPAPCRRWNFNPRSPHGERHTHHLSSIR